MAALHAPNGSNAKPLPVDRGGRPRHDLEDLRSWPGEGAQASRGSPWRSASEATSSLDPWLPRERLIFWLLLVSSLSALGGPITVLVAGLQLANVFGLFRAQSFGVYLLSPLLLLCMACLMFVAFLIYPSRRSGPVR